MSNLEQQRLGLLQCPNAVSLGWGGASGNIGGDDAGVTTGAIGDGSSEEAMCAQQSAISISPSPRRGPLAEETSSSLKAPICEVDVAAKCSAPTLDTQFVVEKGAHKNVNENSLLHANESKEETRNTATILQEKLPMVSMETSPVPLKSTLQMSDSTEDGPDRKKMRQDESSPIPATASKVDEQIKDSSIDVGVDPCASRKDLSDKGDTSFQKEKTTKCDEEEILSADNDAGEAMSPETAQIKTDVETKPLHLASSLDYETNCPWRNNSDESKDCAPNKNRSQILTISYHGGGDLKASNSLIVVGTIAGRARIELLDPLNSDVAESAGGSSENCSNPKLEPRTHFLASSSNLSLDIYGFRLHTRGTASSDSVIINRPSWMNPLLVSVIIDRCHCDEERKPNVLRVRLTSIDDSEPQSGTINNDGDYYSAYPEETFSIQILPQRALYPGNYTRAGNGLCTIPEPWKQVMDKITKTGDHSKVSEKGSSLDTVGDRADDSHKDGRIQLRKQVHDRNRILLCGAKGVGKSTFLRYAVNRLLSNTVDSKDVPKRIAILDLDSGQPELSPPGMLSLTIISLPIFSDPPLHMVCGGSCDHNGHQLGDFVEHEASYFYGDITSKADPDTFIQMASQLMRHYDTLNEAEEKGELESCNLPLVVNTDGWVKGLGYEILSAIIGAVNPDHVVQIVGSTKAKSFDMSSHETDFDDCVADGQFSVNQKTIHTIQSFDPNSVSAFDDDIRSRRSIDSGTMTESSSNALLASASDHRTHRLCAYFHGGYNKMSKLRPKNDGEKDSISFHKERGLSDPNNIIASTLASMHPYIVPFHLVHLYPPSGLLDSLSEVKPMWGVRGDLASNDVLQAVNGAIVGLCCKSNKFDVPLKDWNSGMNVPILQCLGLGVVRSIDCNRKIFFVLTPVHPRLLANVSSFVGGNIGLPLECLFRGVQSESFPFMTCGHVLASPGLGADVMKSRNHSGRHGSKK